MDRDDGGVFGRVMAWTRMAATWIGHWLEGPGPVWLATLGPVGRFPVAPGTVGTAVGGLPLAWFLGHFSLVLALPLLAVLTGVGIRAAGSAEKALAREDPGPVVIDEVLGMAVTLLGVPFSLESALLGFAAFRFFDIRKPWGIRTVERRYNGGLGIVLDDLVAGVYAQVAVRILLAVLA